mmetsp:Transcript_63461/g.151345  ORF Transcript_63461/g.151345 Transcript_63461/m.151345 type:complete len:256 (-) Transcript_63461:189-956(-)
MRSPPSTTRQYSRSMSSSVTVRSQEPNHLSLKPSARFLKEPNVWNAPSPNPNVSAASSSPSSPALPDAALMREKRCRTLTKVSSPSSSIFSPSANASPNFSRYARNTSRMRWPLVMVCPPDDALLPTLTSVAISPHFFAWSTLFIPPRESTALWSANRSTCRPSTTGVSGGRLSERSLWNARRRARNLVAGEARRRSWSTACTHVWNWKSSGAFPIMNGEFHSFGGTILMIPAFSPISLMLSIYLCGSWNSAMVG